MNINPPKIADNTGRYAYIKKHNKEIKNFFNGKINGNFLINIKTKVFEKIPMDIINLYPINNYFDNKSIITGTNETAEYDICRLIIGVHRHHSIFLTQEKIKKNEKDEIYQEQIANEVIEKVYLKDLSVKFFRKEQLFTGDNFLFFPVPCELFTLSVKLVNLIAKNSSNFSPIKDYTEIIKGCFSVLTLMENSFLNSAYSLCRGMIELYLKLSIINKHPNSYKMYAKFAVFEIEQSCCSQKYPEEFIELYENRLCKNKYVSRNAYLHFGWLDSVPEYNVVNSNRYTVYGLFDYLMGDADNNFYHTLNDLRILYKVCHGYVHGSANCILYPIAQYFEISKMLFYIITNVFYDLHKIYDLEILPEDKKLLDELNRDFETLCQQHKKRSIDNFKLYYSVFN